MLKTKLKIIRADLDRISKLNSDSLFEQMVQSKLDNSYDIYCKNLELNYNYLLSRSTIKVLKTVKRQNAKKAKEQETQQ